MLLNLNLRFYTVTLPKEVEESAMMFWERVMIHHSVWIPFFHTFMAFWCFLSMIHQLTGTRRSMRFKMYELLQMTELNLCENYECRAKHLLPLYLVCILSEVLCTCTSRVFQSLVLNKRVSKAINILHVTLSFLPANMQSHKQQKKTLMSITCYLDYFWWKTRLRFYDLS